MSGVKPRGMSAARANALLCAGALLLGLGGCSVPRTGPAWQCSWLLHCPMERELRASAQPSLPSPPTAPSSPRGELAPISLSLVHVDYFQGLLVRSGVPPSLLPGDGSRLSPAQAFQLLSWVLQAEVPLKDFGPWRMSSHLLWQVAQGSKPVSRDELHQRMRDFSGLLVLRPDGCLVRATTGVAVQQVGPVQFLNGSLRAEGFEVGPFYTVRNGMLYAVEADLEIHPDTLLAGVYAPQEGTLGPLLEGAGQAVFDSVEGIVTLVLHPIQSLQGLAQLPSAVRTLIENSPEYWEHFRLQPHGAQVRAVSRLLTTVLLTVGSSGVGSARLASLSGRLGKLGVPVLSLSADGVLALRRVAVPAGQLVTAVGDGASAVYVLHMAHSGATRVGSGSGGGGSGGGTPARLWPPPPAGPGQWVRKNEGMKLAARQYQCQVTGAPEGWVYRVVHNGEKADFDGFRDGALIDAKGPNYDNKFTDELDPKPWFERTGAQAMLDDAKRQARVADGVPIEWHVAEAKAAEAIRVLLQRGLVHGIEVIHTPALP